MTLPTPDAAFHWTSESWGHALRCQPLSPIAQHVFTTRQLQLRPSGSPATEAAWTQAAAAVGARLEEVLRVKQVHGATVRRLARGDVAASASAERPEADAIVSNAPGLALCVQVADCVPILVADPENGVVAAVHAGWKGTAAGVAPAAVRAMRDGFGSRPEQLIAAIGPSIGPCCYEVGAELADAFRQHGHGSDDVQRWFAVQAGKPKPHLDLWTANRDLLATAGLPSDHIYICRLCTKTHAEVFDSFRVDGERAGRMAALIRVPAAPRAF